MKTKRLLSAFGQLDEQYMEEAFQKTSEKKKRPRGKWRAAAAAILLFAGVFGTAMAVSAQFRQIVLSFFHIEQAEPVPKKDTESPGIAQSDIDGLVRAEYIRLDKNTYDSGYGTLRKVEYDEDGNVYMVRFWAIENGSKVLLPVQKNSVSAIWQDTSYQGTIYWCVSNGQLSLYDDAKQPVGNWQSAPIPGRTDAVFLLLSKGRYDEYRQHLMLYRLDTGETEDILQQTETENLPPVENYRWSDDGTKIILTCWNEENEKTFYCCDLTAKTLTNLSASSGIEISEVFPADSNTLIFLQAKEGTCSVFTYDLISGAITETLHEEKLFEDYGMKSVQIEGLMLFGKRYGLFADPSGNLSVADLKTGTKTQVNGFTLETGGNFLSNPANTKFLYSVMEDQTDDSLGISKLGVLDLKSGTFTAFDRKGYENLSECSLSWFDNNRVQISSGESGTDAIYLYEF